MNDLATTILEAAGSIIREKHNEDSQADFATILVVTDFKGVIKTHRFDVANRRNGKAEDRAAVACRRGADRFLDIEIGASRARLACDPEGPTFQWVFISTKTKNAAKDEAIRDNASLETLDHPAVDRFLLAFTGNTILESRITLKPSEPAATA